MARSHAAPPPVPASFEDKQHLWEDVADQRVGMLATFDSEGALNARPVSVLKVEPNGTLWFFVAIDGGIAHDVKGDPRVHMSFMDRGDDVYVSLRGTATVFQDAGKAKSLWNTLAGAWFPGGPEDPNLGILEVNVERGDYWDVDSSKLVQFFELAKAALTKTPPTETGKHKQFTT